MFNKSKFLGLAREYGITVKEIAKSLNISAPTLYRKMSGQSDFTRGEIQKCCELFKLQDMNEIFFAK